MRYNGKTEEKDVLEGVRPDLLRKERVLGGDLNLLIFGDNLAILKAFNKEEKK